MPAYGPDEMRQDVEPREDWRIASAIPAGAVKYLGELSMTKGAFIMLRTQILVSGLLVAATVLTACETSEDKAISAAQSCLDNATVSTQADACLAMVSGLDTAQANVIKCSAMYIKKGFTSTKFANAFDQLKANPNGTGGQAVDGMGTATSTLAFTGSGATADADTTLGYCTKSGSLSMQRLATLTKLGTYVLSIGSGAGVASCSTCTSGGTCDSATMASCLTGLQGSTGTDKTAIGTIAIGAQTSYCGAGSSYANTEVCTNLNNAIASGNGDLTAIADALLNSMKQ